MAFEVYNPKNKSKSSTDKKSTTYILTQRLKQRLEVLKKLAVEDFKKAIWINVYARYKPVQYIRTYSMIEAVSVSEVKQVGNSLYFDVYIDKNKLEHFSVVSGTNYYDGQEIYPPALVLEGHKQEGYDEIDYFRNYPAANFMTEVLAFIKSDLEKTLVDIVKYEIKRLGGKKKY